MELSTYDDTARFGSRITAGGNVTFQTYPTPGYYQLPIWLKLVRVGNVVTGYSSVDGFTWGSALASAELTGLSSTVYIGLAVASANQSVVATSDFYGVTVLGAAPDFNLTVPTAAGRTISTAGGSTYGTVRITPVNGISDSSAIAVTGLPADGSYALSSLSCAPGGYTNVRLTLPAGLAPGPYPVTGTATSGALIHSLVFTMTVSASGGLPAPWAAD